MPDGAGARRGRAEYLNKFSPAASAAVPSIAGALVERMAARLLVFFVRHAALLRPLGHAGKLQLAQVRITCCCVVAMRSARAFTDALQPHCRWGIAWW